MPPSAFEQSPVVRLEGLVREPFDLGVAAARTCYSSKGIIRTEDINRDEKSRALGDRIAASTLEAGHLTTRQHAHFVFSLDKVSRHTIWSFLHSHPFYNSEQVSQRYVRVSPGNVAIPRLEEKYRKIYLDTVERQMAAYMRLIELLLPVVETEFFAIFPSRQKTKEKYRSTCLKRCYEIARYVLPVATHAYLYHTVSALTLIRYWRYCDAYDTPTEQRELVEQMVDAVRAADPHFEKDLVDPLPFEETPEYRFLENRIPSTKSGESSIRDFDAALGNHHSRLIDYKIHAEKTLATSIRHVLGMSKDMLSDRETIALVLDPKRNPLLAETINGATLSKLMRSLAHIHYTFSKKLSHTADSQDQRHRMTPASRPMLQAHYTGKPDYLVPPLIEKNAEAHELYTRTMDETWEAMNHLLETGLSFEWTSYLSPNALAIRFEESGDLLALHHKWKARSCYTAQEEIFHATVDELRQVKDIHPAIAEHILAPCYLRYHAGIAPFCPEGDRFCGVRVWKQDIDAYERLL